MTLTGIISQRLLPSVDETLLASREILINTPAVANLIRESKVAQIKTAIQTGAEDGMITMDQDLKNLYKKNKITRKVAEAALMNAEVLG
jgi:twitching motility protein PilT